MNVKHKSMIEFIIFISAIFGFIAYCISSYFYNIEQDKLEKEHFQMELSLIIDKINKAPSIEAIAKINELQSYDIPYKPVIYNPISVYKTFFKKYNIYPYKIDEINKLLREKKAELSS